MIILPSKEKLEELILHQIKNLFLLDEKDSEKIIKSLPNAIKRTEACFERSQNKYYKLHGSTKFNIYHSGQYCIFLYFLAREIYLLNKNETTTSDKIYYLNKSLNCIDLFYEIEMPNVFHLDHPIGSVLGRATYGENFTFSQNCTVGNNKGIFPKLGKNVTMHSGSKILGDSTIGDNVTISANCYIKDSSIPNDRVVFGESPNLSIKQK
ncbi:hypothetical protein N5C93_15790 [Pseudomonas nitroreducens]|uniref:transferase n=1 Tax=Pseudomonas nitroreducens TaxID=46680 RepID=UPI00147614AA|nr:transferase [Pseudomonas nitroreducens]MDG9857157.1 hypothetical protein [Pseudomonas nitroreducens]MDH1074304.1 hypothetical protein [Pseudomonas nitroreducens]NMZ72917.1 transferase [Pseudomonas nitroreducens]